MFRRRALQEKACERDLCANRGAISEIRPERLARRRGLCKHDGKTTGARHFAAAAAAPRALQLPRSGQRLAEEAGSGRQQSRASRRWSPSRGDRWPLSERENEPPRRNSRARRGAREAGIGAGGHQHRRHKSGGARPRDERRAQCRERRLHGRPDDLRRLSGVGRVHSRHALRAARLRRGDCRLRGGSEESAGPPGHPAGTGGTRRPADPFPEQDRSGGRQPSGDAGNAAAGVPRAAAAAPDPGLGEWRRHRLHRSRARAGLRLPRGRPLDGRRDARRRDTRGKAGALFDAGEARGLRRRAYGAVDQRHRAAQGPGLRRSGAGVAGRTRRSGADGLGDWRARRDPAVEGCPARGAACGNDAKAARNR